ncbi:co-chaperone DjlA [Thorsellia kenyensis]|uniref:Co-chaperone protein DjlA n=1 Tax=Thorsellia kenyensis TaxID=1549888 RepID=A0ABV6CCG6_9GAMM
MKNHLGKIIAVLLTYFFFSFNFVFIVLAIIIGHLFDRSLMHRRMNKYDDGSQYDRQQVFFITTFQVMGHLSKAKGVITQEDIKVATSVMDRFSLDDAQRQIAQEAYREGKDANFPLRRVMRELRIALGRRFDLVKIFLEIQLQVALADGSLHPNEKEVLRVIASELGISRQFEAILSMIQAGQSFGQQGQNRQHRGYQQNGYRDPKAQLKEAYTLLGVSEGSDAMTIKRAYRKLMSEHHPDKLVAKGLPPEMMEIAKEKTQAIQGAYELLKAHLGFK